MPFQTSFTQQEIRNLFKQARTVVNKPFVEIRKAPTTVPGRMLIVIPRKVGNAVQRNRLRRRIRELLQPYELTHNYIFRAKTPEITTLSFEELASLLDQVIHD